MGVYVDRMFPTEPSGRWPYAEACHLFADRPGELRVFARRLGLHRSWFQDRRGFPHYDLTRGMRERALRMGVTELTGQALLDAFRRLRGGAASRVADVALHSRGCHVCHGTGSYTYPGGQSHECTQQPVVAVPYNDWVRLGRPQDLEEYAAADGPLPDELCG
jgi:hypothetical protein